MRPAAALVFQFFGLPALVGLALGALTVPLVGLAGMLVAAALVVWRWKRAPAEGAVTFRIEAGQLIVTSRGSSEVKARLPLRDLLDITLETKGIERVTEGGDAIPTTRLLARHSADVAQARIVLVCRGNAEIPLSDTHLAQVDTSEGFGRIRVFLRKHGWVPADEDPTDVDRQATDVDPDEDQDPTDVDRQERR